MENVMIAVTAINSIMIVSLMIILHRVYSNSVDGLLDIIKLEEDVKRCVETDKQIINKFDKIIIHRFDNCINIIKKHVLALNNSIDDNSKTVHTRLNNINSSVCDKFKHLHYVSTQQDLFNKSMVEVCSKISTEIDDIITTIEPLKTKPKKSSKVKDGTTNRSNG